LVGELQSNTVFNLSFIFNNYNLFYKLTLIIKSKTVLLDEWLKITGDNYCILGDLCDQ